jgi:hypothetical protein
MSFKPERNIADQSKSTAVRTDRKIKIKNDVEYDINNMLNSTDALPQHSDPPNPYDLCDPCDSLDLCDPSDQTDCVDEVSCFLSKIQNKYSGNAEQKHLNQMYDIGILVVNKNFNQKKLISKITKIIEERSHDPIKRIKDMKKKSLIGALKKGIDDAMSEEYRCAYDLSNTYQYDKEKLKKRARIDRVLDNF